jgi:hypothetical protein
MTHKIITTENYLLVVDDSEIKYKTWYLDDAKQVRQCVVLDTDYWKSRKDYKKIIAHLPLNNSPILEGVDLLPPLEDEVEKLADEFKNSYKKVGVTDYEVSSFTIGYNKAKEKYKYTEEHILDAWELGASEGLPLTREKKNNLIKHLQQPKMPVGFECEMDYVPSTFNIWEKTIINSQGLTQWVGEYIY